MASTELIVAFEAKIDGLTTSLRRVTDQVKNLQTSVAQSGSEVQKSMDDMGRSFGSMVSTLVSFRNLWIASFVVNHIVSAALAVDDLNSAINRLKAISGSTLPQARDQMFQLSEIAARTGQPVTDMVNQFQRFYVATASLGATTQQVRALVEVLAGFAQLSGQRPQEAAAAITQLSQALASGRLNGDELKSIMENMPQLAIEIAKQLGVSTGELRKMGEEGRLVTDRVFPALLRMQEDLNKKLEDLPKSLRQGWQIFSDGAVGAIAALDRAIGSSQWLAQFLANVGGIMSAAGRRMEGTGPNASPTAALENLNREARELQTTYDRLIQSRRDFETTGLSRTGVAAPAAQANERQINQTRTQLEGLRNRIVQVQEQLAATDMSEGITRTGAAAVGAAATAEREARAMIDRINPAANARADHAKRMGEIEERHRAIMRTATTEALQADANRLRNEQIRESTHKMNQELESAGAGARADAARQLREDEQRRKAAEAATAAERERAAVISRAGGSGIEGLTEAYARWNTATENANSNYEAFANRVAGNSQLATVGFDAVTRSAEVVTQSMVRMGRDSTETTALMNAELIKFRDLMIASATAAGASEEVIKSIGDQMEAAAGRGVRGLELLRERADTTWNDIASKGIKTFATDLSGAIVDFAMGAKKNFGEMAVNFLANIAKMILNMMILRAIASSLGALGLPGLGNMVLPGSNPIAGRMSGGPVTAGTPYVVGEKRPELFVPGASGYIVPSVPSGEGGGTVVNIINNSKASVTQSQTQNSSGGMDINVMIEEAVNNAVSAGRFDKTLGTTFGVRRIGRN